MSKRCDLSRLGPFQPFFVILRGLAVSSVPVPAQRFGQQEVCNHQAVGALGA